MDNPIFPIFTLEFGRVYLGTNPRMIPGPNGTQIPVIAVGEKGRGRTLGALTISGYSSGVIKAASVVKRRGKWGLIAAPEAIDTDQAIMVLRTLAGAGGNQHTGNLAGCCERAHDVFYLDVTCTACNAPLELDPAEPPDCLFHPEVGYSPFPGQILARGSVAPNSEQLIALVPQGAIFRTAYAGQDGDFSGHAWIYDGQGVHVCPDDYRYALNSPHLLAI